MKILQVDQSAVREMASDIDQAITRLEGQTLLQKYNALRREMFKLRAQLHQLEHANDRDDAELERDMQRVREFINSMTREEGAVTCANIYTKRFLELDNDPRFVVQLCETLVNSFRQASILIEPQYNMWTQYANKR